MYKTIKEVENLAFKELGAYPEDIKKGLILISSTECISKRDYAKSTSGRLCSTTPYGQKPGPPSTSMSGSSSQMKSGASTLK